MGSKDGIRATKYETKPHDTTLCSCMFGIYSVVQLPYDQVGAIALVGRRGVLGGVALALS